MPQVYAGALIDRAPGRKYTESLRFAEISLRAPLPRPGTFAKWRKELPENFTLSLVAPKSAIVGKKGPLRFDEELEAGVTWLDESATALSARFVVIQTGADLTTGQRDRDLLTAYFERLRKKDRTIVWSPSGLWEPELAEKFAARHEVLYAFDPIEAPVPVGEIVYARLAAIGHRSHIGEPVLRTIVEALDEDDIVEGFVAIDSPTSFQRASRLQELFEELANAPADDDEDDDSDDDE